MPKESRFHIDKLPESPLTPKYLTKQEFGRRLYRLMLAKGWNQSELARQAGLPRDSISTYIRGRTLPTPKSLQALADALGTTPGDVFPGAIQQATMDDTASIEIRSSTSAPGMAWLQVNRLVTLQTAVDVAKLLEADRGPQTSDAD